MDDADRRNQVETVVGGHTLRRLSPASYDRGNPLVKGEGTPGFTSALRGFVFAHCATRPGVVRASFDGQALP